MCVKMANHSISLFPTFSTLGNCHPFCTTLFHRSSPLFVVSSIVSNEVGGFLSRKSLHMYSMPPAQRSHSRFLLNTCGRLSAQHSRPTLYSTFTADVFHSSLEADFLLNACSRLSAQRLRPTFPTQHLQPTFLLNTHS